MRLILFISLFFLATVSFASFENLVNQTYLETQKRLIFPNSNDMNATIKGGLFIFDLNKKNVFGKKKIKLSYGNMITSSDKIIYNVASKKIKVEGNTLFKRDNLILKSDSAYMQFPEFINAEGSVSLSYNTYMSSSDFANYNLSNQKVTFIGDVNFFDKKSNDNFYGNKIIFDLVNEEILSIGKSRAKLNTKRLNK